MATKTKTKVKSSAAQIEIPQTREQCATMIKRLGDAQRQYQASLAEMNAAIADITQSYQPVLALEDSQIVALQQGIQTWCEANRVSLCPKDSKTANLVTGEISWRIRPPSVRVIGADAVLDTLRRAGLERFVRVKSEVNKEAILNEPEAVRGIAGLTISSGVEDFVITPFEQEAA